MSYCVNCGVELGAAEKVCPLCSTVVLNPNVIPEDDPKTTYPRDAEELLLDLRENTRLTALIISVLLALPAVVCMVCAYGINHSLEWSVFVVSSCALLWCFIVPPVLWKRAQLLTFVVFDTIAVAVFLYTLYRILIGYGISVDWFTTLALPITICSGVFVGIVATAFHSGHLGRAIKLAIALFATAALMVSIEVTTDLYISGGVSLSWSLIALTPCAIIAILILIINRKQKLKASIAKRTFV